MQGTPLDGIRIAPNDVLHARGGRLSVNVGAPRVVGWRGRLVRTSIFKEPVSGPVAVRRLNVDGDEQSDPSVHGRPDKAIYAHRAEHDVDWRRELPDAELGWGAFGENLSG